MYLHRQCTAAIPVLYTHHDQVGSTIHDAPQMPGQFLLPSGQLQEATSTVSRANSRVRPKGLFRLQPCYTPLPPQNAQLTLAGHAMAASPVACRTSAQAAEAAGTSSRGRAVVCGGGLFLQLCSLCILPCCCEACCVPGGPAGLVTSLFLAQQGYAVDVYEMHENRDAEYTVTPPRSFFYGLGPRAQQALEAVRGRMHVDTHVLLSCTRHADRSKACRQASSCLQSKGSDLAA